MEYKLGVEYTERGIEPVIVEVEQSEHSSFDETTYEYTYRRLIFDFNGDGRLTISTEELMSIYHGVSDVSFFEETGIIILLNNVVPYLKPTETAGLYTFIKGHSRKIYCGKNEFRLLPPDQ